MCLCVLVHQWLDDYPLVMAANREEHYDRPSTPPEWLAEGRTVLAGVDKRQGGTWQGLNEQGLMVALTNRSGTIQDPERRSRGQLCLDALNAESARNAVDWLLYHLHNTPYNPCNLLCADAHEAFVIHYDGVQASAQTLSPGLHLLSSTDVNDPRHPRLQHAHALLQELPEDWPALNEVLRALMADHDEDLEEAARICLHGAQAGTVSSSLIALRAPGLRGAEFHFADGPPCTTPYADFSAPLRERA